MLRILACTSLFKGVDNMLDESVFEKIRERSEGFFKLSHHSKSHVERVYNLAVRIAKEEKADLDVVKAAVLLHDIARALEDEGKIADHATEGAKMARKVLEEVHFPKEKGDRLDILGAIGIARVFARGGWENNPIYDPSIPPKEKYDGKSLTSVNQYEKILKVKDTINTKTAKEIAEERHKFVEQFLERFLKEWKGEI